MKDPKTFSSCFIQAKQASDIFNALSIAGYDSLAESLAIKATRSDADAVFVETVQAFKTDDIQVDEDPFVSRSDDGAFVMTWHWVSNDEAGLETGSNG